MLQQLIDNIPGALIKFCLVTLFSLLVGLEQRRHYLKTQYESLFGTDRTFTLIGILGFILYALDPLTYIPFLGGGLVIATLLVVYYYQKMTLQGRFGATSIVTALITYCFAPLVFTQPQWMVLLIVISILVITEIKDDLLHFSAQFDASEFTSLAKFLALTGVILPLLPHAPIAENIPISPFHFWLAIVVVSAISYLSYILRKFVFPSSGLLFTGFLGGLYSSTATTVILSRKSKTVDAGNQVLGAIFLAIGMMFLRIIGFSLFFNAAITLLLIPYLGSLALLCFALVIYFIRYRKELPREEKLGEIAVVNQNPLEFKTAVLFGVLFVVFALVTGWVIKYFGGQGITLLSFIVGVTDIDPFILNLLQGKWAISNGIIGLAILNAITSNNVLKFIYAYTLSDKSIRKGLVVGFSFLVGAGIIAGLIAWFLKG